MTKKQRIILELERGGPAVYGAQANVQLRWEAVPRRRTGSARKAAARSLRTHRRTLRALRHRIRSISASGGDERARLLTLRALKLWEQSLLDSERSVTRKKGVQRRAAARRARKRFKQTGKAIDEAREALGLPTGKG